MTHRVLQDAYDKYSFAVIPKMGEFVTGDRASYQYLIESIRRFPNQDDFAARIKAAGFAQVGYQNYSGRHCSASHRLGGVANMFEALSDYLRLARAGAVMLRNDVVIPDAYRSRMPWAAKFAGGRAAHPAGRRRQGRPGQRFARSAGEARARVDQARPVHGDTA